MGFDKNISVLVVEDNAGFTQLLDILLRDLGLRQIEIAHAYEDGLRAFEEYCPDICILDIDLGTGMRNGIQLAEYIRETQPYLPLIYLTANYTEEYYQLTRHTFPSSFLNKEISRFKLEQAIDIALMHRKTAIEAPGQALVRAIEAPLITHHQCFFKIGDVYKGIPTKEITFFYADNKLTYARVGTRNYPTNVQLKTLEDEFSATFARIHKTYLVNVEHISSVHPKESTLIAGGETLPIGYAYRNSFLGRLNLLK